MQPGTPCDRLFARAASALLALAVAWTGTASAAAPAPIPAVAVHGWIPGNKLTVGGNVTETVRTGWRYGYAIAMNDRYAVVGAPDTALTRANGTAVNGAGSAYVYKRTAGTNTWTFCQRLIAPELSLCQTGSAVAIDPVTDDIIVGAWAYGGAATFGGGAFVYAKGSGDSWGVATTFPSTGSNTRMPSQELLPADLQAIDQFGFSVAMDNGTAVIGCPLSGSSNSGALYVYVRGNDGTYAQKQKLLDDAGGANDQLGTKVSVSGNLIAAGIQNKYVQGKLKAGSSIVWKRATATADFQAVGHVLPSTITAGAQFGASIAVLDGATTDYLVVGAPVDLTNGTSGNGAAYVFSSHDGETWQQDDVLGPRVANVSNSFGYSVAMSHNEPPVIAVGAPGYDTALETGDVRAPYSQIINAGSGFSFVKAGSGWDVRGAGDLWSPSIATANTSIGRSVAVAPGSDDFALVGGETPTSSTGNVWSFMYDNAPIGTDPGEVAGPASGPLGEDGLPTDGSSAGTGSNGTGGGISGGGSPSGGTDTSGGVVAPLSPITYSWGTVKGSVVAVKGQRVSILQTDGKNTGNSPSFRTLGTLPAGAEYAGFGDVNGDKSGDILFVTATGVLKYWVRDGFTIKDTRTIDVLPTGYDVVAVADFSGDGKPDVLLQDSADPTKLTVWNLSAGAISGTTDYQLPTPPVGGWQIVIGKFRSSAASDILIRNAAARDLRLLLDTAGNVTFPRLVDRGRKAKLLGIGDLNADNHPDILWGMGSEIDVDLYTTNDTGAYVVLRNERTGLHNGAIADVRDWNGDGKVDLLMRNGSRLWFQYTQYTVRSFPNGSRDLGNAPGTVQGVTDR